MTTLKFEHLTKGSKTPPIESGYGGLLWEGYRALDVTAPNTPTAFVALQRDAGGSGVAVSGSHGQITFSAPSGYSMKNLEFYLSAANWQDGLGRVYFTERNGDVNFRIVGENDINHVEGFRISRHVVSVTIQFADGAQFAIDDLKFKLTLDPPNLSSQHPFEAATVFDGDRDHGHALNSVTEGGHAALLPFGDHLALP